MSTAANKLWFGFSGTPYTGNETSFFESRDFEWAQYIESNFSVIKKELSVLFDGGQDDLLKPYFEDKMQYPPKNWKTESFCYWGRKHFKLCKLFPETYAILSRVPGLVSASINLLEPGSKILPHFGDTNGIYRCHLGLSIPGKLPECGFKVNGEERPWEEGKLLIFLDAYTHEAVNMTGEKRYILLFDVVRPNFRTRKYDICITVLSMLTLYWFFTKIPALLNVATTWPDKVKLAMLLPFRIAWFFYLPVSNTWRKYHL